MICRKKTRPLKAEKPRKRDRSRMLRGRERPPDVDLPKAPSAAIVPPCVQLDLTRTCRRTRRFRAFFIYIYIYSNLLLHLPEAKHSAFWQPGDIDTDIEYHLIYRRVVVSQTITSLVFPSQLSRTPDVWEQERRRVIATQE